MAKKKTDKPGLESSKKYLQELGYCEVEQINHPTDLRATMDGEVYWFEVKYTESDDWSFGAATSTEWECALENPDRFFFLIANKPGGEEHEESEWNHILVTPDEFIQYSTIPPFKIYFKFPLQGQIEIPERRTAIQATGENLRMLIDLLEEMRPMAEDE